MLTANPNSNVHTPYSLLHLSSLSECLCFASENLKPKVYTHIHPFTLTNQIQLFHQFGNIPTSFLNLIDAI